MPERVVSVVPSNYDPYTVKCVDDPCQDNCTHFIKMMRIMLLHTFHKMINFVVSLMIIDHNRSSPAIRTATKILSTVTIFLVNIYGY